MRHPPLRLGGAGDASFDSEDNRTGTSNNFKIEFEIELTLKGAR